MFGDDLGAAADHHPVHVAFDQHIPMSVGHRHRVVVGAVPHQGQRTDPAGLLVAGVIGHCVARATARPGLAPSAGRWSAECPLSHSVHTVQAACFQVRIQRRETLRHGYRHQEVAPHIAHHAFNLALVIPLAGTPEPILEQVVGLELAESPRAFATTVSQYLRHREFRIVVQDALGHSTQKGERRHVPVQKGLGGLPGISLGEAAVAVGQVQDEVMHLALQAGDHRQRFAEVALGVARSVGQGHEHLPNTPPMLPHVVLDYGLLAFKSVLVPQPLEDALGRVPLLSGRPAVRLQDGVNYAGEGLNLRFARRPLPRVALAASHWPASCAPCPDAGQTLGGLPNAHPLHPGRPGAPENTCPRETSIAPSNS